MLITLLLSLTATAKPAEPTTIASTSLCGDSYLLALAPDHISALSWQSRSPLSLANDAQKQLPQLWDDPEVLLSAKADYILFGAGEGAKANALPAAPLNLIWGENFSTLFSNAKMIEDALALKTETTQNWSRRIEALTHKSEQRGNHPKILYLSRSGGSAGRGTLVDAAITAAGGVNIAETSGWFTPDPEHIIAYDPDLIITSYFKNGYESVQSSAVRNKAVQRFIAGRPNVEIDGNLWPCAGPGLIEAAELISDAIDKLP
ncbi:ABC transporter substrate-binding protein [Hellea sp.]|nr:ABC transporter substrate-binding protein [Hellea sp.]